MPQRKYYINQRRPYINPTVNTQRPINKAYAHSGDTDQKLQKAVSDPGLHLMHDVSLNLKYHR